MPQKNSTATVHLTNHVSIALDWLVASLENRTVNHIVVVPDRGLFSYLSYELAKCFSYPLLHVEIISARLVTAENDLIELLDMEGRCLFDTTARLYGAYFGPSSAVNGTKETLETIARERRYEAKDLHDFIEGLAYDFVYNPKNMSDQVRASLSSLLLQLEEEDSVTICPQNNQLHFFGFSSLETNLLERLLERKNCCLYLLSPCMMYWEDLFSDRELRKKRLPQADEATLEALYWSRHPLLANSGRPSQKTVQIIHDRTQQFAESYLIASSMAEHPIYESLLREEVCHVVEEQKITFLQMVQADLLTLSYKERPKIEIEGDESIQIASFKTRLREVYALHSFLLKEAARISKADSPGMKLIPGSLIVYVPRLIEYLPFIERVFENEREILPYEIVGAVPLDEKDCSTLFFHTIEWAFKRISTKDVVRLLQSPFVQQKLDLDAEEFSSVVTYIDKSAFFEGRDSETLVSDLLAEGLLSGQKGSFTTWQDMKKAIAASFMKKQITGLIQLDTKGAESLLRCVHYIDCLFEKIDSYKKEPRLLSEWAFLFEEHLCLFFGNSFAGAGAKRKQDRHLIEDAIMRLATIEDATVDLKGAFRLLKRMFYLERSEAKKVIQAPLVFASTNSMRGCPAQVIAYIGMHEETYDENDNPDADCDEKTVSAFMGGLELPFIESLHSAHSSFYVSYQAASRKTGVALSPLAPVQQLIDAIENGFRCKNRYIKRDSRCTMPINTRQIDALKAMPLLPVDSMASSMSKSCSIDIALLREVAKNPLRVYLQKGHGIVLQYTSEGQDETLATWIDSLLEWQIKQALLHEKEPLTNEMRNYAPLAAGDLKKAAIASLEEESARAKRAFEQLGIKEKVYTIELLPTCEAPEWVGSRKLCMPAVHIQTASGPMMITGTIGPVADEGLILFETLSSRSYYASYPDLLVLSLLGKTTGLYSIKDVKKKKYVLDAAEKKLASFITYAEAAIHSPSLLMPDWIKAITGEMDPKSAIKKIFKENAFTDPYTGYFISKYDDALSFDDTDLIGILENSKEHAALLFGDQHDGNDEAGV